MRRFDRAKPQIRVEHDKGKSMKQFFFICFDVFVCILSATDSTWPATILMRDSSRTYKDVAAN